MNLGGTTKREGALVPKDVWGRERLFSWAERTVFSQQTRNSRKRRFAVPLPRYFCLTAEIRRRPGGAAPWTPAASSEETPPLHFRLKPKIPLSFRFFFLSPPDTLRLRSGGDPNKVDENFKQWAA